MATPRRVEENIAGALSQIRPGDFVELTWIDASQSKNVKIHRLPLPNHAIETRKVTRGRFVCVQRGQTWRDDYIVVAFEKTDDSEEIVAVPVCLLKQISSASFKEPLKALAKPKTVQRFSDGVVKRYR